MGNQFSSKKKSKKSNSKVKQSQEATEVVDTEQEQRAICVVGAGLTGLSQVAALLRDIKNDDNQKKFFNINLIEKRSRKFLRSQKLIVATNDLIPGIIKGITWGEFALDLFDPNKTYSVDPSTGILLKNNVPVINLNKREKFLRKILRTGAVERKEIHNFSIKSLQYALLEHIEDPANQARNAKIDLHFNTDVQEVTTTEAGKQCLMTLSENNNNEKPIEFDTLILCEGENHEVTDLVSDELERQNVRPFTYFDFPNELKYHAILRLKLKSLDQIEGGKYKTYAELFATKTPQYENELLKNLIKLGWQGISLPGAAINTNFRTENIGQRPIFGFSTDLPESIYRMPEDTPEEKIAKEEKIIEWSIYIVAYHFKLPIEYFEFDRKGGDNTEELRLTTFSPHRRYVDRPVIQTANATYVVLGDAAKSPYHVTGNSAREAMNMTFDVTKAIVTPDDEYEAFIEVRRKYNLFKNAQYFRFSKANPQVEIEDYELYTAIKNEDFDLVKDLLAAGKNPNSSDYSSTVLLAVKSDRLDILQLLLDNGANPNTGPSAALSALRTKNYQALDLLFRYGFDPNLWTPTLAIVELLIKENNYEYIAKMIMGGLTPSAFLMKLDKATHPQLVSFVEKISVYIIEQENLLNAIKFSQERDFNLDTRNFAIKNLSEQLNLLDRHNIFKTKQPLEFIETSVDKLSDLTNLFNCINQLDKLLAEMTNKNINCKPLHDAIEKAYERLINEDDKAHIFTEILDIMEKFSMDTTSTSNTKFFSNIQKIPPQLVKDLEFFTLTLPNQQQQPTAEI